MKCIAYALVSALSLFGCAKKELFTDCLPLELQQDIIAFYPFNEGSLKDKSLHGNDLDNLTLATPIFDRDSNFNCAYFFDNYGQNISHLTTTESGFLDSLNSFTVAAWYKNIDPINEYTQIRSLVSRGNKNQCPDRTGEWSLSLFDFSRGVFGNNVSVWTLIPVPYVWHQLIGVKNYDVYTIYLDGVKYEEIDFSIKGSGCSNFIPARDIGDFYIGRKFNGSIDDVIIFNRALSDNEIKKLYLSEPCCK